MDKGQGFVRRDFLMMDDLVDIEYAESTRFIYHT